MRAALLTGAIASAILATGGQASADDPVDPLEKWVATPVITSDGKTIIVPQREEDGARGFEGFKFVAYDRRGVAIDERATATAGEQADPAAATQRGAEALKWINAYDSARHLKPLSAADAPDGDRTRLAVSEPHHTSLVVTLDPTGKLTVTPPGGRPVTKASARWRTKPDAAQQAEMQARIDEGKDGCFNPSRLGDVWLDVARRVAVVHITFSGNDSCWEPSGDYAVLTW